MKYTNVSGLQGTLQHLGTWKRWKSPPSSPRQKIQPMNNSEKSSNCRKTRSSQLCSDAGLKLVQQGPYFCVPDTTDGQQMQHSCREYTMPRYEKGTHVERMDSKEHENRCLEHRSLLSWRKIVLTSISIPVLERIWINVEAKRSNDQKCFGMTETITRLLRHDLSVLRRNEGAIHNNDIIEECRRKTFDDTSQWLLEDWRSKLAKGWGTKKRFQYCAGPNSPNQFQYLRAVQGNPWESAVDPGVQDKKNWSRKDLPNICTPSGTRTTWIHLKNKKWIYSRRHEPQKKKTSNVLHNNEQDGGRIWLEGNSLRSDKTKDHDTHEKLGNAFKMQYCGAIWSLLKREVCNSARHGHMQAFSTTHACCFHWESSVYENYGRALPKGTFNSESATSSVKIELATRSTKPRRKIILATIKWREQSRGNLWSHSGPQKSWNYVFLQSSRRIQHARTKSRCWSRSSQCLLGNGNNLLQLLKKLKSTRSPTFDQNIRDVTSILGKKQKTWNSARCSERQEMYFQTKQMRKKAQQRKHGGGPTTLSKWYDDEKFRMSLSDIGWREHHIISRQYTSYVIFLMQWTRTHCCTSHCMAQVLVHASSHPHNHPCVRLDRLFSPFFLTLLPSVCFPYFFFFYLNLISVRQRHTDQKQMGLQKEHAGWKNGHLQYHCNQVWTKNGVIPWNVIAICETFKISCLLGRHHMKCGSECPPTDQCYRLEQWSNITLFLRKTNLDCINFVQKSRQVFSSVMHGTREESGKETLWSQTFEELEEGRIRHPRQKAQCKGSVNADERWQFYISSRRWNSQNTLRRSTSGTFHLNQGSSWTRRRTRSFSRRIRRTLISKPSSRRLNTGRCGRQKWFLVYHGRFHLPSSRGTQSQTAHAERRIISHSDEEERCYQNNTHVTLMHWEKQVDDAGMWMEKEKYLMQSDRYA